MKSQFYQHNLLWRFSSSEDPLIKDKVTVFGIVSTPSFMFYRALGLFLLLFVFMLYHAVFVMVAQTGDSYDYINHRRSKSQGLSNSNLSIMGNVQFLIKINSINA